MKTKIEIKHWMTGSVLFEFEKESNTVKDTLVEANLREADLREANLREADLRGADLYGANLREADLRGADLYGANLREANLREADLRGANLREADLREANLREADLREADLRGADLYGADLYGADLYGANLWQLPRDFINQCSRDILFIFQQLKSELTKFKEILIVGKINGSQYTGTCACLCGSFANIKGEDVDKVCKDFIPFYEKGTHNAGESWFLNIKEGDTPENNQFSAHVLKLVEMVEKGEYYSIKYDPTEEQLKTWEKKWKK